MFSQPDFRCRFHVLLSSFPQCECHIMICHVVPSRAAPDTAGSTCVFARLEVFQDMQVTQIATLIDPDSRRCVSSKWLLLQMYCISPLGALKGIIFSGRRFKQFRVYVICLVFWPVKNPAERADGPALCFTRQGRDICFVSSASP